MTSKIEIKFMLKHRAKEFAEMVKAEQPEGWGFYTICTKSSRAVLYFFGHFPDEVAEDIIGRANKVRLK